MVEFNILYQLSTTISDIFNPNYVTLYMSETLYLTHCTGYKMDSLRNTNKKVTPDKLYTGQKIRNSLVLESILSLRGATATKQSKNEIASLTEFTLSEVEGFARNDDETLPSAKLLQRFSDS